MKAHNKGKKLIAGEYYAKNFRYQTALFFITVLCCSVVSYALGLSRHTEEPDYFNPVVSVEFRESYTSDGTESARLNEPSEQPGELTGYTQLPEYIEVKDYIYTVFGEHADDAMKVLECENKVLDPSAIHINRNHSRDIGIFQLNDRYWGGDENLDYKTNVDKAYEIFQAHDNTFYAWTCGHVLGQTTYLTRR